MKQESDSFWYREFFSGAALELWRRAIPPETTEAEVQFLLEVLKAEPGSHLLDVPCGYGRLTIPLALAGYHVTGVDICREFLDEARESAVKHAVEISLAHKDMLEPGETNKYDGGFCMGNSFGYFDRENSKRFFQAISKSLRSGSRFVLDSGMVAESFLLNGSRREWLQAGDMFMLVDNRYDCRESVVYSHYTFLQQGTTYYKSETRQAKHWIYTCSELCNMLVEAGFVIENLFSTTDGDDYRLGSDRLLLVAGKA